LENGAEKTIRKLFLNYFNRHPFFKTSPDPKFMESYWCTRKNSIVNRIRIGIDFDPALTPCLKCPCNVKEDRNCIHIRRMKNQRPCDQRLSNPEDLWCRQGYSGKYFFVEIISDIPAGASMVW
jgi:hypothetical protein